MFRISILSFDHIDVALITNPRFVCNQVLHNNVHRPQFVSSGICSVFSCSIGWLTVSYAAEKSTNTTTVPSDIHFSCALDRVLVSVDNVAPGSVVIVEVTDYDSSFVLVKVHWFSEFKWFTSLFVDGRDINSTNVNVQVRSQQNPMDHPLG